MTDDNEIKERIKSRKRADLSSLKDQYGEKSKTKRRTKTKK
ncbi:MAG: hypothetical protein ACTSUO_05595 [Candidatus Thorarchaeota archaeon]